MNFNFELILFYATVISGLIALYDILFLAPKRKQNQKMPVLADYARSFFPILLIVFLLRSFLFEPFRIPSGSLEPTLLKGDFILVNKFHYGLRLPVIHKKVMGDSVPKRGDVMVFRWPPNPSFNFIKRVIGLPGDKISYINKELYVNGEKVPQSFLQNTTAEDETGNEWHPAEKQEDLLGVKHHIFVNEERLSRDFQDVVVPNGMYFVMGDNRDDSDDSRYWGFVPDKNVVGKAMLIWMSWRSNPNDNFVVAIAKSLQNVRWNRIGKVIH